MNNKLFRSTGIITRDAQSEDSRLIEGFAIVFDKPSRELRDEKGWFIEKINRNALSEEMLVNQDVIMNIDHDNSRMLARYVKGEGTLHLELREEGLYFSFEAPDTALGNEVLFNVRNGNLFECSFAFIPSKRKRYRSGDSIIQEIEEISNLFDCSIVVHAAYPDTEVSARDKENLEAEFEEAKAEIEEEEKKTRDTETLNALETLKNEFLESIK